MGTSQRCSRSQDIISNCTKPCSLTRPSPFLAVTLYPVTPQHSGPCSSIPPSTRSSTARSHGCLPSQPSVTSSYPSISLLLTHVSSLHGSRGHDPLTLPHTAPCTLSSPGVHCLILFHWSLSSEALPPSWSLLRLPDSLSSSYLSPSAFQCSLACLPCLAPRLIDSGLPATHLPKLLHHPDGCQSQVAGTVTFLSLWSSGDPPSPTLPQGTLPSAQSWPSETHAVPHFLQVGPSWSPCQNL